MKTARKYTQGSPVRRREVLKKNEYRIFTGAGPVVTRTFSSTEAMKQYVESHSPLLKKRGYSGKWLTSLGTPRQYKLLVRNSKGKVVHTYFIKSGEK